MDWRRLRQRITRSVPDTAAVIRRIKVSCDRGLPQTNEEARQEREIHPTDHFRELVCGEASGAERVEPDVAVLGTSRCRSLR